MKSKSCGKLGWFLATMMMLSPAALRAAEFEVFDGRVYNGKYYPRIDVIEWNDKPGDPSYMTFHVYSKNDPVDLGFELEESKSKKVMLVNYLITSRDEHQCRRVLAPQHFTQGYLVYRDRSDPDYDEIIVSMQEMPKKKGRELVNAKKYASCDLPDPKRLPAAETGKPVAEPNDQKRPKNDKAALKKQGASVPFSDW